MAASSSIFPLRLLCTFGILLAVIQVVLLEDVQAPRFTGNQSASSSVVAEGHTKILYCKALGYPEPEYQWLKDGIPLGGGVFSPQHYHRIHATRREDAGVYQCVARNIAGAIFGERIRVSVAHMGSFEGDSGESVLRVSSGRAAVLTMPPIRSHPPPAVSWVADDATHLYGAKYAPVAPPPSPPHFWTTNDTYGEQEAVHQLVILSADAGDQKAYRAQATNTQIGKEENSAYIRLIVVPDGSNDDAEVPPEIVVAPANITVVKGESLAELHCIANARPLHQLETTWLKDGVRLEPGDGMDGGGYSFNDPWNRTLSLLSVGLAHHGHYSCHVRMRSGGHPPASASAYVNIIERPSFTNKVRAETLGEFGSTVTLPCEAQGVPQPKIVWYRNTVKVNEIDSKRYVVAEDGSLQIRKLRMEDSGMFQCIATNDAGEESLTTWLRVKTSAPVMEHPPQNLTILDGKDATLICQAAGAPTPNITWTRADGSLVSSGEGGGGRVQVVEGGSLLVAAVRESDAGEYVCTRANEAGSVTASAFLSVLVRTRIVQPPDNAQVILGLTATFQCKVSGDPAVPYTVQWFTNNQPIPPGGTGRFTIEPETHTLSVREVRAGDAGTYSCSLHSPGGNDTRSAKLKVVELPYAPVHVRAQRITPSPASTNTIGKHVNVSWTPGFDGNSQIVKFILQRREVPTAHGDGADDMVVDAATGEVLLSPWLTEDEDLGGEEGGGEAGSVHGNMRWVVLKKLRAAAAYQFRVSAVNAVGEGPPSTPSNTVTLPQEPPSGPPLGLVGTARSSSEIIVQWQPPNEDHRNGLLLGYLVRYRLYGYHSSPWSFRNITNEAQRNYLIRDLITWKDYEVQIAAYNAKGVGEFSDGIRIKTKEGVPEAPPTQVRAEAANSTAVRVWWTPPDPQKINGINQGYKLQAWRVSPHKNSIDSVDLDEEVEGGGAKDFVVVSVPPSLFDPLAEQTAVVGNLAKATHYNITVVCFTDPGDGPRSRPVAVQTQEDVPEEVGSLQFDDVSDRAVRVTWTPPRHPNGVIISYGLRYSPMQSPSSSEEDENGTVSAPPAPTELPGAVERKFPADVHSVKVENLRALTHYSFEVWGVTKMGRGPSRSAVIQSGVEPVLPHAPVRLALSNIGATSVVLQFALPFDGNSSIVKWTVEAQSKPNGAWWIVHEERDIPSARTLVVGGLIPFAEYRLRLTAHNVVGPSPPSQPTNTFQTIQAPPAHPPANVTVRALSATQLRVRWIPLQPIEWYGNPKGYNVSYREIMVENIIENTTTITLSGEPIPKVEAGWQSKFTNDPTANSLILGPLEEWTLYEVVVRAINEVGASDVSSPPAQERTREAVPSMGPVGVEANATSSTTVVVRWGDVPKRHQNGLIEGFKVAYYSTNPRTPLQYKEIPSNSTHTTTLTELRKYVTYQVFVLAYNRLGDGVPSQPPVSLLTFEDVPGPPSNVSFPDVSLTTARIIWDVPLEPNGRILAYKVSYHLHTDQSLNFSKEFPPSDRTYRAVELQPERYYSFSVEAQTRLGWGRAAHALVYTTASREPPQAPSAPHISRSQIQSHRITFSWTPGRDGYAPIRYYTVQRSEVMEGEDGQGTVFGPWVEVGPGEGGPLGARVEGGATSLTASGLQPATSYAFRIRATNDMGHSTWSPRSEVVRTLPAAPSRAVENVRVVPITTTSVRVDWTPLSAGGKGGGGAWSGDSKGGGYRVHYRPTADFPVPPPSPVPSKEVKGTNVGRLVLEGLQRDVTYEVWVLAFNSQGEGPPSSPPASVYVGEAVPTGEPKALKATALAPTEVALEWEAPAPATRNGELLGYKIFYLVLEAPGRKGAKGKPRKGGSRRMRGKKVGYSISAENSAVDIDPLLEAGEYGRMMEEETEEESLEGTVEEEEEELEVVPASHTSHTLAFLDKYTTYRIQVLAFNPAGDGPRSSPVTVKTLQGIPGPPGPLVFSEITMNSLRVGWDPPQNPNGEIFGYVVAYETRMPNERFSKQVKQVVSSGSATTAGRHWLLVQGLEEEATYMFTVKVQNGAGIGPAISANVTTGPQDGSPTPPRGLAVARTASSVRLSWGNGPSGKGPLLGYYIESQRNEDGRWQTVVRTGNGPLEEYSISYQNLLPSTSYSFRVIAHNKYGVSCPAYSDDAVVTPSKLYLEYGYLQQKPFYRQTWFMVALAATSLILIITVIAVLCVKSKSYKYKQEAQKTLEESMRMDMEERQELAMEMYHSMRRGGGGGGGGTLGRKGALGALVGGGSCLGASGPTPMLGKSPPRPSPASVAYHSEDEDEEEEEEGSTKGYDENPDDSSLTEKPSEMSSTDSQGSETDDLSEGSDMVDCPSVPHETSPAEDPDHSFVNHYANVNDSLRQSWKRQRPVVRPSSVQQQQSQLMRDALRSHNAQHLHAQSLLPPPPLPPPIDKSETSDCSAIPPPLPQQQQPGLNGGRIVLNNMARSRAPLPGFSSFV
ncbi:protein sidekick [Ischnura elegans]|uniref:protein sidekick n=1 Tax=Ischnura elegans TaxID=197161 RepID=UPI001ED87CC6|nr:protein sidekick [Ischnura elegans]